MINILVLHGPNLNLLGKRETGVYGRTTLPEINRELKTLAQKNKVSLTIKQSNAEGRLVDLIQKSSGRYDAMVFNPAAYTHTSVAIRDAIASVELPTIEIHLSNIYRRESFRRRSYVAGVSIGQISGFGSYSYQLGLLAAIEYLKSKPETRG